MIHKKLFQQSNKPALDPIFRWMAYISSAVLFIIWGAFFVEHLSWFKQPNPISLPWQVWLLQFLHLSLLSGYLMIYKWPRAASLIILVSAVCFFAFTAGKNFVLFSLISILPVLFIGLLWSRLNLFNGKKQPA